MQGTGSAGSPTSIPTRKARGPDVTFEEVRAAVAQLTQANKYPSIAAVRSIIGRGGDASIREFIVQVRSGLNQSPPVTRQELSAPAVKVLECEIERVVKSQTAQLEAALKDTESALDEALARNAALDCELAEAARLLESTRASSAEHSGAATALQLQCEKLTESLRAVQSRADASEREAALLRSQLSSAEAQRQQSIGDCAHLKEKLAESERLLEQRAADLEEARRSSLAMQAKETLLQAAEERAKQAAQRAQELQEAVGAARNEIAAALAEKAGLASRLSDSREALGRAEETIQSLLSKVPSLSDSHARRIQAGVQRAERPSEGIAKDRR